MQIIAKYNFNVHHIRCAWVRVNKHVQKRMNESAIEINCKFQVAAINHHGKLYCNWTSVGVVVDLKMSQRNTIHPVRFN